LSRATMRTRKSLPRCNFFLLAFGRLRTQEKLKSPQFKTTFRMKQSKRAHAMKASRRHVLQKSPQKLLRRERHHLALPIRAALVSEGHRAVFVLDDGRVGDRSALHVAS